MKCRKNSIGQGVLTVVFVLVFVSISAFLLSGCDEKEGEVTSDSDSSGSDETEKEKAIRLAKEVYEEKKKEGMDFSDGPCIDDDLMEGWVADIAHDPRQPIDNQPENQCPSYGDTADHFVELDEDGELIQAI